MRDFPISVEMIHKKFIWKKKFVSFSVALVYNSSKQKNKFHQPNAYHRHILCIHLYECMCVCVGFNFCTCLGMSVFSLVLHVPRIIIWTNQTVQLIRIWYINERMNECHHVKIKKNVSFFAQFIFRIFLNRNQAFPKKKRKGKECRFCEFSGYAGYVDLVCRTKCMSILHITLQAPIFLTFHVNNIPLL